MAVFDSSSEFSASGGAFTLVSGGHEIFTIDNTGLYLVFAVAPITAPGDITVDEDGNALALVTTYDNVAGGFSLYVYERTGLVGTGFHTVSINFAAGRDNFAGVGISYTDVAATGMIRVGPVFNGNSAAPSVVAAPGVGEFVFALTGLLNDTLTITEGPGLTNIRSANAGGVTGLRMNVSNKPGDISSVLSEGISAATDLVLLGVSVVDVGGGVMLGSGFGLGAGDADAVPSGTYTGAGLAIGAASAIGHGLVPAIITGSGTALGEASMNGDAGTLSRSAVTLDALLLSMQNDLAILKRGHQAHTARLNRLDGRVGP